ncbi:MAG: thioredoxin domain-containing protein, partial [Dethiobacteria bacterium]|nr:thioredoxin domain-containing protein [Dethiobacteria bacterium]
GDAPKFPAPHQLLFLLRYWKRSGEEDALKMAVESLRAMHRGGIFDQLGYGMHRYSVDKEWLVPHFEKMLYDQALIAISALEAYRAADDQEMALFARRIFSYLLTDLLSPEGAFYSAEDADSEGEEGTFYVWRPEELKAALGEERGRLVAEYYGVSEKGNFEHSTSILHRRHGEEAFAVAHGLSMAELQVLLEEARAVLLTKRALRERPFRDDKIITAWNGLAIAALARGAIVLEEPLYLAAAECAAAFIAAKMVSGEGRLLRRYREGEAAIPAFLDDYANLAWAHLELYKAGGGDSYLESAERLSREMLTLFEGESGILRYSATADDSADFALEAEAYDGATPSGVSVAAMNLLQLGKALQDETLSRKGEGLLIAQQSKVERYPTGFTYLLTALDYALSASEERFYCTENGCCGLE